MELVVLREELYEGSKFLLNQWCSMNPKISKEVRLMDPDL